MAKITTDTPTTTSTACKVRRTMYAPTPAGNLSVQSEALNISRVSSERGCHFNRLLAAYRSCC